MDLKIELKAKGGIGGGKKKKEGPGIPR